MLFHFILLLEELRGDGDDEVTITEIKYKFHCSHFGSSREGLLEVPPPMDTWILVYARIRKDQSQSWWVQSSYYRLAFPSRIFLKVNFKEKPEF